MNGVLIVDLLVGAHSGTDRGLGGTVMRHYLSLAIASLPGGVAHATGVGLLISPAGEAKTLATRFFTARGRTVPVAAIAAATQVEDFLTSNARHATQIHEPTPTRGLDGPAGS